MHFFRRISIAILALLAFSAASQSTAAPAPIDPAARAAFIKADREALLARIHPKWRDFKPQWREEICPFQRVAKYDPDKVTCGYVLVPENRREASSRLIRIAVARHRSIAEGPPQAGAMVYLSGGPGGPSAEGAANMFPDRLRRHREWLELGDFYFVDQRGVGYSDPPLCRGLRGRNDLPLSGEAYRAEAARFRACIEEGRARGIDPDAYSTWDNALDFRDIRRALGLSTWNLFGVSYGTELGQMILRVDGEGIRAAVLDSLVAPRNDKLTTGLRSAGLLSSIRNLNEACVADGDCARRYGDLETLARKAVAAYDAEPFTVDGLDKEIYKDGKYVVNGSTVAYALFQALYASEFYPAIPALLEALATRDADRVMASYAEMLNRPSDHEYGYGMETIANCSGQIGQPSKFIADQAKGEPFWSEALLDRRELEYCVLSGRPPADPLDAQTPLITARPVLLLAGGIDPITPPYNAEAVKAGLPDAAYVLSPWVGHGVARSDECVGEDIMPAFLADPAAKLDVSCVAEMKPQPFVLDYKRTSGPIMLYRAYEKGEATGALGWLGASLAVLVIGVFGFAVGPIARRIDGRAVVPAGGGRRAAMAGAVLSLVGAGLLGWAFYTTVSEHLLLAPLGLAGPARAGGWLILAGAAIGLAAIVLVARAATRSRPPVGTILGVLLMGVAGAVLAGFAGTNGLL